MKKIKVVFSILFILLLYKGNAQEEQFISESEVISMVLENNLSQKISEQDFLKAKADYQQTNAIFLPNITASYTGAMTTNPLMAFGFKLNQGIIQQSDFDPNKLNNPSQTNNFATAISFEQPLINIDGIYQRKAAKHAMESQSLQLQRKSEYLHYEAKRAYQELQLAYLAASVLEETLKAAQENYKVASDFFKQGLMQQADLLLVEIHLTEIKNELLKSKSNVKNASNYISFLTNNHDHVIFKPQESMMLTSNHLLEAENLVLSENRADIKAMEIASEAAKDNLQADRMAYLPRLNAFGSYEMHNEKIFNSGTDGYLLGAQLSWNIFEGSKRIGKKNKSKASYEASKLAYEEYTSQSQMELNQASRQLNDAKNRLELTEMALKQSEEALRIKNNRFKEGLEKTSDLLMAETQFAQKQLEYYQTIFEYNRAQSYLTYLMTN